MHGVKEDFSKLKANLVFMRWRQSHLDAFFSYAFTAVEGEHIGDWQFGFFDNHTNKVTSFIVKEELVQQLSEDEVFREPGKEILETNVESIQVPILEIFDRAIFLASQEYPHNSIVKILIILQNLQEFGNVWNITLVTNTLSTINVKMDPSTGEVKSHKLASLFDFQRK